MYIFRSLPAINSDLLNQGKEKRKRQWFKNLSLFHLVTFLGAFTYSFQLVHLQFLKSVYLVLVYKVKFCKQILYLSFSKSIILIIRKIWSKAVIHNKQTNKPYYFRTSTGDFFKCIFLLLLTQIFIELAEKNEALHVQSAQSNDWPGINLTFRIHAGINRYSPNLVGKVCVCVCV